METQNLLIRPFEDADAGAFLALSHDEGLTVFAINDYRQKDHASARTWIQKTRAQNEATGLGKWGVWMKRTGELVGLAGLTPWVWEGEELVDITYRLKKSVQGMGLGFELARALVERGRELPLTATITPDNLPSIKLTEKLGFRYDKRIQLLGVATELYRLVR